MLALSTLLPVKWVLVLLLISVASASRSRTLRNAGAKKDSARIKSLFDEWLEKRAPTAESQHIIKNDANINGNKQMFVEVKADGGVLSKENTLTDKLKRTLHPLSENPQVSKFFADCNDECIDHNIDTYCVFPKGDLEIDLVQMMKNFGLTAIDQSGEGGFVTAFHGLICGFAMNAVDMLSHGFGIMTALENEWMSIKKKLSLKKLEHDVDNGNFGDVSLMGYVMNKIQHQLEHLGVEMCEATMPSIGIDFIGTINVNLGSICKMSVKAIIETLFNLAGGPLLKMLRSVMDWSPELNPGYPFTVLTKVPEAADDDISDDEKDAEICNPKGTKGLSITVADCEWIKRRLQKDLEDITTKGYKQYEKKDVKELQQRVMDGYTATWQHDHRINSDKIKEDVAKMKQTMRSKEFGCHEKIDKKIEELIAKGHGIIITSKRKLRKEIIKVMKGCKTDSSAKTEQNNPIVRNR